MNSCKYYNQKIKATGLLVGLIIIIINSNNIIVVVQDPAFSQNSP